MVAIVAAIGFGALFLWNDPVPESVSLSGVRVTLERGKMYRLTARRVYPHGSIDLLRLHLRDEYNDGNWTVGGKIRTTDSHGVHALYVVRDKNGQLRVVFARHQPDIYLTTQKIHSHEEWNAYPLPADFLVLDEWVVPEK